MTFTLTTKQIADLCKISTQRVMQKLPRLTEGKHYIKVSRIYLFNKSALDKLRRKG